MLEHNYNNQLLLVLYYNKNIIDCKSQHNNSKDFNFAAKQLRLI